MLELRTRRRYLQGRVRQVRLAGNRLLRLRLVHSFHSVPRAPSRASACLQRLRFAASQTAPEAALLQSSRNRKYPRPSCGIVNCGRKLGASPCNKKRRRRSAPNATQSGVCTSGVCTFETPRSTTERTARAGAAAFRLSPIRPRRFPGSALGRFALNLAC